MASDKLDLKAIATGLGVDPKILTELDGIIKSVNYDIPPTLAKELLVKFWAYKSLLTEWITKAKKYERECKLRTKQELSRCKNNSPETSEAGRTRWAEEQQSYQTADAEFAGASLFREHLDMKREDLREGHYMCKVLLDSLREDWRMSPGGSDTKKDF